MLLDLLHYRILSNSPVLVNGKSDTKSDTASE